MENNSISSELVNLEDALSNQSTAGRPIKTFVGVNCGSRIFTIHMSLFELIQHTEVANEQSKNSNETAQRPLNIKHANALAVYMLKGLLNYVRLRREKALEPTDGKLEEIIKAMGSQPYFALAPLVSSFRNCSPNGTNLKVVPLVAENKETAAYKIFLNSGDVLWIVDGQHRRKAAEIVLDFLRYINTNHKYPSKGSLYSSKSKEEIQTDELSVWNECLEALKYCTISMDVHLGLTIEQERQLFHDLNNLVKSVEKSLAFQFDGSNPVNQYIKDVLIDDKFVTYGLEVHEKDQSDWGKSGLSRKELVGINSLLFLNKTNINGATPLVVDPRTEVASNFWEAVLNIPNIDDTSAKLKTVAAQPVVLKAIAKLYFDFFFGKNEEWRNTENQEKFINGIHGIDFSHSNPMWQYYTFSEEERTEKGLTELKEYLPSDDAGKNRDLGAFDATANTFRFGAKHNDIHPLIADMIRWKLNLPTRQK